MALQEFERRLERLVEGVFAKAFRSRLTPVEIGRRITREMDVRRTVGVRGVLAPNTFTVAVSQADHEAFAGAAQTLRGEWAAYAREHAREEGYVLVGPLEVDLVAEASLGAGEFLVSSEMVEGPGGGPVGALVLGDGSRVRVAEDPITIGRSPDCDVFLSAKEVSRHHAEVRRDDDGFLLVDLGSMNGTQVNGAGVKERRLADGDEITLGRTVALRFELE